MMNYWYRTMAADTSFRITLIAISSSGTLDGTFMAPDSTTIATDSDQDSIQLEIIISLTAVLIIIRDSTATLTTINDRNDSTTTIPTTTTTDASSNREELLIPLLPMAITFTTTTTTTWTLIKNLKTNGEVSTNPAAITHSKLTRVSTKNVINCQ